MGRVMLQTEVVKCLTNFDVDEAIAMLKQIAPTTRGYDARGYPEYLIVAELLAKNRIADSIALLNAMASTGNFSYRSAAQIIKKLPANDPQGLFIFGSAVSEYTSKPDVAFGELPVSCWKSLPKQTVEHAVDLVMKSVLDSKNSPATESMSISTGNATVNLGSKQNLELFSIVPVIRGLDPKRADEILATRPELKSALETYPEGMASLGKDGGRVTMFKVGVRQGVDPQKAADAHKAAEARMRFQAMATTRAEAALAALKDDPQKAISLAKTVPVPAMQAQVLGSIAQGVAEKDPATARSVLKQCLALVDELKDPGQRTGPLESIARAAHQIQDEKMTWELLDRLLADADELYKKDTNADRPNRSFRENWPSVDAYRRAAYRAAEFFGVDAEPVLFKITDQEINLLVRIEMAQALLGRPQSSVPTLSR
jgi:hypothetical protein